MRAASPSITEERTRPGTPLPLPPPPFSDEERTWEIASSDIDAPEIETYLELEADLPPEAGDPDLESELALNIALSGDLERVHDSTSATIADAAGEIRTEIETVANLDEPPSAVTVIDPPRAHALRAKRHSEGWDE